MNVSTASEASTKLLLLREQLSSLSGADAAGEWTEMQLQALVELVRKQKGVCEDRDVCLLSEVKAWFKQAGVPRLGPREAVVKAVQAHLWPTPPPRSETVPRHSQLRKHLQVHTFGALGLAPAPRLKRFFGAARSSLLEPRGRPQGKRCGGYRGTPSGPSGCPSCLP